MHINNVANNIKFGKNVTIYPFTVFEITASSNLVVGNNFTLSYGAVIACNFSIKIGNHVMIGEFSSIRDTTHNFESSDIPFCMQPDKSAEIIIEDNVWIGKGSLILPGTIIEKGVIIGAHSLVKGHLLANSMYAGTPLKLLKKL